MMKPRKYAIVFLAVFMLAALVAPAPIFAASAVESTMTLATTTSTQDSGLLDTLLPVFEKEYNTKVKVVAVGSGQAMEMGRKGDADVLLVHSRKAEDQFVKDGYGINRKDVMHNQFLIVGPKNDPAKIKGMTDATAAFKKIAAAKCRFVSRADKSGTDVKEKDIWAKAKITPTGRWYIESGQGMGDTLMMANEMNAYTLSDDATYLTWRNKTGLIQMVSGDSFLYNPYGVIAVNPAKYPSIHKNGANAFINFITGPEGQKIIANYGVSKFGKTLFTPDAIPAASISTTASSGYCTVNAKAVNIRSGAGTNYRILGSVKYGTRLEIAGKSGSWYKVKYGKGYGFIAGWLVKK
ncbi:MAG TPA: substrate-binding domain-containing protein [Syntrophomonadaceae bacterium]|nr:substrate-binding domain-containing protein [Syntrophomonadaceae bacterium]